MHRATSATGAEGQPDNFTIFFSHFLSPALRTCPLRPIANPGTLIRASQVGPINRLPCPWPGAVQALVCSLIRLLTCAWLGLGQPPTGVHYETPGTPDNPRCQPTESPTLTVANPVQTATTPSTAGIPQPVSLGSCPSSLLTVVAANGGQSHPSHENLLLALIFPPSLVFLCLLRSSPN